jgi:penicillin amidase
VPFFNTPGVTATQEQRRDIILLKSLADGITLASSDTFAAAFAKSTNLSDYRWGKLHRIVLAHPLGEPFSTPPANGRFPAPLAGLTGIPKQGGFGVVDASSHSVRAATLNGFMFGSGPTRRFVAEMTKGAVKVESSLPGGVSGSPASPFYVNLLPMWLTNETFPMSLQTGPTLPWIKY